MSPLNSVLQTQSSNFRIEYSHEHTSFGSGILYGTDGRWCVTLGLTHFMELSQRLYWNLAHWFFHLLSPKRSVLNIKKSIKLINSCGRYDVYKLAFTWANRLLVSGQKLVQTKTLNMCHSINIAVHDFSWNILDLVTSILELNSSFTYWISSQETRSDHT